MPDLEYYRNLAAEIKGRKDRRKSRRGGRQKND
jgi:hypothetical protein